MHNELSTELRALYKKHIPEYLTELIRAFEVGDLKHVEEVAHKLAPVMGSMKDDSSMALLLSIEREKPTQDQLNEILRQVQRQVIQSLETL